MFAEDLDAFTADFGVPVQFAGAPATLHGLEDVADQDVLDAGGRAIVVAGDPVVTLRTDAVAGLKVGAALTVNAAAYTVRQKHRVGDGAFTLVALQRAAAGS
jgi:hypothetical protein